MDQSMAELNDKVDALTAQVAYLAEQAHLAERAREERAELMHDMMPIAHDVMRLASDQLAPVQDYADPADLLRLLVKLLRHRPQLEMLLDQIDGVMDLVETAGPIGKEGMDKATVVLDELDRKGYFAFAQGGLRIVDNIVTSFTEEDVRRLGDNIVLILNTVKDMTQPQIMNFLRSTLLVAEREVEKPVDISYRSLVRQMQDPAVRRGLALTLRVLHVVGSQASGNGHTTTAQ